MNYRMGMVLIGALVGGAEGQAANFTQMQPRFTQDQMNSAFCGGWIYDTTLKKCRGCADSSYKYDVSLGKCVKCPPSYTRSGSNCVLETQTKCGEFVYVVDPGCALQGIPANGDTCNRPGCTQGPCNCAFSAFVDCSAPLEGQGYLVRRKGRDVCRDVKPLTVNSPDLKNPK